MKWIWRAMVTIVALLALAVVGLFVAGRMTLPTIDGTVALDGPAAEIRIVRDRFAIPHIYAASEDDALFALGYTHAQDRLWQMELQRRIGQGRLSEFAGPVTVQTDIFLRTLGLYRAAEATMTRLDARTQTRLQRYADGVNAWLTNRDGLLPPEFLILGIEPEPWLADSIVWLKVMALNLSGNYHAEALRAQVAALLGPERMRQIWPAYPKNAPVALGDQAGLWQPGGAGGLLDGWPAPDPGTGSNNWVIDGRLSATGKPLLANDPHLGLQAPAVWYFAHLEWAEEAVIGGTLPGVPFVVLGRNRSVAWGFTNTDPDTQDLLLEQLNPENPSQYRTSEGWADFTTREEVIEVSGAEPQRMTVRESVNGPILTGAARSVSEMTPEGYAVALRWHILDDDEMTVRAGLNTATVKTVREFQSVMRDYHNAQQNMVAADIDGNIGFVAAGRVPVRADRSDWQGMLPQPGWTPQSAINGYIPYEELPQVINPERGYVVTANNRIVGDGYAHFLTNEWAEPYRAQRITDLLTARQTHTIDSFRSMQADRVSLMAREFLPLMLQVTPDAAEQEAILADLRVWNGDMDPDRYEPTVFHAWYREFVRQVLVDQTGDLFDQLWAPRVGFFRNVLTGADGADSWCDDTATDQTEDCAEILARALSLALADLEQRYGGDRTAWTWGTIHAAHSDHTPFTNVDLLRDLFDIRAPVGGDSYTVNVAHGRMRDRREPFATRSAASMRAIYDLDDPDRSIYVHSTGQSGNPLSQHYDDMVNRWRRVDYIPMSMRREDIEPGAIGTLILRPGAGG
ncbi:MAG: penicillin acylase family protein [Minwuia sp.]|uniref:penicillin acylase family protein n=1 Tax=Minwuia sp. TaxID=2493630 RepID=UPI003A88112C